MKIEFDSNKNSVNRAKHGLDLVLAALLFDGDYAEFIDLRFDYGEERLIAYGLIEGRHMVCVYVWRGSIRRIISLRKANSREINEYYQSNT